MVVSNKFLYFFIYFLYKIHVLISLTSVWVSFNKITESCGFEEIFGAKEDGGMANEIQEFLFAM